MKHCCKGKNFQGSNYIFRLKHLKELYFCKIIVSPANAIFVEVLSIKKPSKLYSTLTLRLETNLLRAMLVK